MQRRSFIGGMSMAVIGIAGCLGEMGTSNTERTTSDNGPGNSQNVSTVDETETVTETTGTPDPVEDIMIETSNNTSNEATVQLTLSSEDQTIVDEVLTLNPGESQMVATGIRETGKYELSAVVESGPKGSYPFNIGDYALRQGSNLIVLLNEDDISLMIEE